MNRRNPHATPRQDARLLHRQKALIHRLLFEPLESRTMLSAGSGQLPAAIVIGRTLATPSTADTATPSPSYFVGEAENNQVTITFTVYNEQSDPETGVLVTDTLAPGVTLANASQPPDQSGQSLAWSLGTIPGYERASLSITVNLPSPAPSQLDTGARAAAMLDAGAVSASTPAATLRTGNVSDPSLLTSTPDANTTDPLIQEQAAKLGYDPQQIFNFLQTRIGYNSYVGSVRGARGTLWSGAGNALDVASLGVALMRASGIPAHYAQGTLSPAQAGTLIDAMFPPSDKALGAVPTGETPSNPASDPTLLSETEQHAWFQFDGGSGMKDADPLIPGASVGQAPTTSTGTFAEVPDSLRAKTEIRLNAETYGVAAALFGLGSSTTTVLDQTFNDVDLVGRPITVGNFVSTQGAGGFVFTTVTNTYTPYIELSDEANPDPTHDEVIHGQPYQEVLTNFPLGSQVLTGLFLDVTLSGPQAAPVTYEKTLVDRIGFAARQGSGNVVLPPISPTGQPILTNNDLWTINALPGLQSPAVVGGQLDVLSKLQDQLNALLSTVNAIPSTGPQTPDQQAAVSQSGSLNREIALLNNIVLTVAFARASDRATAQLEAGYQTISYHADPRLLVASTHQDGANLSAAMDLMKNDARDIEAPGQALGASFFFEQMRGYFDSALEGTVLAAATGQQAVTFDAVTQALAAQGGHLTIIAQDNLNDLNGLALSADAKARITQEVNAGFGVVTPTQMVTINGQSTVEWLQVNFATGQVVSVAPDGGHQALIEYTSTLDSPLNVASIAFIGTMHGFAISQIKFIGLFLSGIASGKDLVEVVRDAKLELSIDLAKDYIALLGSAIPVPESLPEWESLGAEIAKSIFGLAVKREIFNPLKVGAEVIKLILGKTLPGFSNLSLAYDAGLVAGSAYGIYYIATTLPGDPPLFPALTTELTSLTPANFATGSLTVVAGPAPSHLSSTINTGSLAVSGPLAASWLSSAVSGFQVSTLSASGATVTLASGKTGATSTIALSGAVALDVATPIGAAVSGNNHYSISGTGSLSFYGPANAKLGVSGAWTNYSATVTGNVSITLTTDGLSLGGTALPAGTYTITASSVTMGGSGPSAAPAFTGSASITATNDTINLGPWTGPLAAGAGPLDPSSVATVTGYSGPITVTANGNGTDAVAFNGSAAQVLQVTASPSAPSTDQNTPVTFQADVRTSFADAYSLTAQAPAGWTLAIDASGKVTATPAPGLQGGSYTIQVIARSTTNPDLVAQTTVNVTITPTQPGVSLTVAPDPLFTVPFQGAQLPTAFRATIHNQGPAADTYNLSFSNVPSGFTILESQTSVAVPAGQTGFIGIYLVPNTGQPIPPAGTQVSFTVTATSAANSSITQTQTETFTMPAIDAVALSSTPTSLSSSPGAAATATLTVQNHGNVSETVTLTAATPSGLTAGSLSPVTLAPGASQTETLTLTPGASASLNQTLAATITASYGPSGSPATTAAIVGLLVRSAQTVAVSQASIAANAANNAPLSSVLSDLASTLASLQTTTSPALFLEAQNDLGNLGTLVSADPALASFATQIQPLITAARSGDLNGLLANATTLFNSITGVLNQEAAEQFTASLSPADADLQPGQGKTFTLQLTNLATDSETLNLSVGNLPAGASVQLGQSTITLASGASTSVDVTLSQTIQSSTIFTLRVTAAESVVSHVASAVVSIRPAAADVIGVTATPQAVNPGDPVTVSAQVFNTANATRSLEARLQVLDSTNTVIATAPLVPFSIDPSHQSVTVSLGQLATTGLADGLYNLQVTLLTSDGSPLPGNPDQTPLLIGIPITASASPSSSLLAPGTSSVTTTIQAANATSVSNGGGASGQSSVLYFTQYTGAVDKVTLTYDGSTFTVGPVTTIRSGVAADGLIFLPNGNLLTANGPVSQVNPITGQTTTVSGDAGADHLALDPSGQVVWTSGQPGPLEEVPLNPFSNAIRHPLQGDDTTVTALAFDAAGNAYYATSSPNGPGDFGTIDLTTFTTRRAFSNLPAAHGLSFDPFTGDLILYGKNHVTQIDPQTLTIVSDFTFTSFGVSFDQGAVDGKGHVYVADNGGHLIFIDYSKTGLVGDSTNFVASPFLAGALDDVAPLSGLGAVTALLEVQHHLPASGYAVDTSSIAPAPGTTSSTEIDWLGGLLSGSTANQQFQLTGQVTNMAPGETRAISTGTSLQVQFTSGSGQQLQTTLTLPPVTVAAEHIIGLAPGTQTVDLGSQAAFTVQLTNPTSTDVTYNLSTVGLDGFTSTLATSITVPAGQTVTTPLDIDVPLNAAADTTGFEVLATTTGGVSDSVEGELTVVPQVALQTRAVSLGLSPTQATAGEGGSARYQLAITNVGSVADTYSLSTSGLPSGVTATLGQTTIDVTPAASNTRNVSLTLAVPPGTTPGAYPFTVAATSTNDSTVTSTASGTLNVTAGGVQVLIQNPTAGPPGTSFQAMVTNTGTTTDTYSLALAGPAALVSSLGMAQVTLAPGASQTVPITTGAVDFAVPGNLPLMAAATSTSNPAIQGAASANLAIPTTAGMTAEFSPAAQTLSGPGTATFLLMVHNTGNAEDTYTATIVGANGPVTATLVGLDGSPTQSISTFRIPALSTATIVLRTNLSAVGRGTVTVQVKSLNHDESVSPVAVAIVTPTAVTPTPTPTTTPTPTQTSTSGPQVTKVQRFGFHRAPTTIVVTFSEALDRSTAEDVHNYRIVDSEGHRIKVTRAVYNPADRTVTLHLAQRLSIHHPYRLTVVGTRPQGISNPQRQLLESQAAGQPGGDFHLKLTWRELVLGHVSRQFLHRYHILPKGERTGAHSADPRPVPRDHQPVVHSSGLFSRSVSFPAHHSPRPAHWPRSRSVGRR